MRKQAMCVLVWALCGVFSAGQEVRPRILGEVEVQGTPVIAVVGGVTDAAAVVALPPASGSGANPREADQTLTTTVQDPGNPDEPWVVVTYKKPGESLAAFIKRHREMVSAVREALNE